jgi:hypothetical protein
MGRDTRYEFKGETDAVVTRGVTMYFGRVGCVLGYTQQSQVILRFRDESERKFLAFPDAAVLNVDCAWPLLSVEQPQLDIHVLALKGLY